MKGFYNRLGFGNSPCTNWIIEDPLSSAATVRITGDVSIGGVFGNVYYLYFEFQDFFPKMPCVRLYLLLSFMYGKPPRQNTPHIWGFSYGFAGNDIWAGAIEAAQQYDVNLIAFAGGSLHSPRGFEAQANVLFDLVDPSMIDGLLLDSGILSHYVGTNALHEFCSRYPDIPIVSSEVALKGIPSILLDFYQGIRELIGHMIETHGCRRIAFIRGPQESQTAEERYQAYLKALSEYGIPFDPDLIAPGTFFAPSGTEAIQLLLDERQVRFDAIAAANDWMVLDAMQAIQMRGIRVPTDVAVVGFDDQKEAGIAIPPLTTAQLQADKRGKKGIELLLAKMAGEDVPEQVILPAKLVVRESCGCSSVRVLQAAVGKYMITPKNVPDISRSLRGQLLAEISKVFTEDDLNSEWIEQFLDSFVGEIVEQASGSFILTFKEILQKESMAEKNLVQWHAALSILRRGLFSHLGSELSRAEDLWQQARTLLGEMTEQARTFQSMQVGRYMMILQAIGRKLLSAFSTSELMDILTNELPQAGIPSFYLALYTNPSAAAEWSHLMLAYNEHGQIDLHAEDQQFPSRQLVPTGILPTDRRYTMVVEALYFRKQQLGFLMVEEGPENIVSRIAHFMGTPGENPLRGQISTALQGALLLERIKEHSAEITRQKYILDTFMENVPDSIFFKDREGRIIHANQAHALRFGLNSVVEEIGKTDFDFFPEEQAQCKYEQEQEILHTGQALLGLEEHTNGDRWMLTTKMPLCDEHGEIIGIFGISRDITELKKTQAELEQRSLELAASYKKIQILNDQLKDENIRMHAEMDLARKIQTTLLPEIIKNIHQDFEIAAIMLPAEEVGGDYYDIALDRGGGLWFGIGDVSGHGLTPGLIMMMAQTVHTTIMTTFQASARDMVIMINAVLFKNVRGRLHEDHFMTFLTIKYLGAGRFQYAGVHLDILIFRQSAQTCELIETTGTFLNVREDIAYCTVNSEFKLEIGDVLVLYTDGLTEAPNPQGKILDIHRFMEIVCRHGMQHVEILRDAIITDVMDWCQKRQLDDMSLVVVRRVN